LRIFAPDALNQSGHRFIGQREVGHLGGGHHHLEFHTVMSRLVRRIRLSGAAESNTMSSRFLDEARN
jgi:hypothetical protein